MLFQALLDPSGGFDIEQLVVRLREPVDDRALTEAWRAVAARYDSLRLCFRWEGLERPQQRFLNLVEPELVQHDWSGTSEAESEARLQALLESDRRRGFDLTRPPWRVHVCRISAERVDLVWSVHHLVVDGRAFATVLDDVLTEHAARRDGKNRDLRRAARPMLEVLRAERSTGTPPADAAFWRALLADKRAPTPLPFAEPTSNPLPHTDTRAAVLHLDEGTTAGLHALAVACDAGMAAVVHALWALFLARWSGESDVLFGSTRSTRRRSAGGDASDVVGMFINTLPVRAAADDASTVRELVVELQRQGRALRDHERASLVDIAKSSVIPRGLALFDTILMFDTEELNDALRARSPAWNPREVTVHEQPAATLVLTAFDGARLKLRLLYQRRRVKDEVAARALRHLEVLARRLAQGGEQTLGEIDSLPEDERRTILQQWNDTARPFPHEQRIHEGFEARVDAHPDALAVVQGAQVLSYRELEAASNRLAHLLRQRGAAPGTWVGLCMDRTPSLVVALLGIAKSGAAYVPFDAEYPADRIEFMLRDSGAELVVTERALRSRLGDVACLEIDGADQAALAAMPKTRPAAVGSATDVCYAIYTSGSTGRPKGVVLTHRAVVNTLDWVTRTFEVAPGDRLLFVTSPCFDLSVYDTFGALAAGATVEVASSALLRDPAAMVAKLVDGDVTIWDSAPQALQRLAPLLPERAPRSRLRLVMLSGDWIPLSLPPALRKVVPSVAVRSLGGATEAAIWSNWFPVGALDPRWASVPYGRPIQNARYHVLDRRMHPVPPGVPGDLYIGGTCLAEGYLHRPELTAERFVRDPFRAREPDGRPARLYKTGDLARYFDDEGPLKGQLEFLGRADFQVKVRGFRVELGEIESVLGQQPDVMEAVCVAKKDASGEQNVWAYVTLRPGAALDAKSAPLALRRALSTRIPDFMVPSGVLVLERMPMSSNGKLDRAALPDPALAGAPREIVPPETPLERRLVDLWVELLGRSPIGIDDNFFELGGHSLLATLLVARLKSRLGVDLPLARVLAAPTIRALAANLEPKAPDARARGATASGRLVTLNAAGTRPALLLVGGIGGHVFTFRELATLLGPDQPVAAFIAVGADGEDVPRQSVEEIAAEYEAELRARDLRGPFIIGGYSFGTLVAFELAHRLRARGVDVRGLVSIDSFAPGHPLRLPLAGRVLEHGKELWKRDARERFRYLKERVDNARRRVVFRLGLGHILAPAMPSADADIEARLRRVWAASMSALHAYRPRFHDPGPLLLFVAAQPFHWPATQLGDATKGWRHFIDGRIDVVTLPGSHLELFTTDNARRMADAIRAL